MIVLMIFLLSWLSGLFTILVFAFFVYNTFSIIDITAFSVFTFISCLLVFPLIYLPVLKLVKRRSGNGRFLYPFTLLIANFPCYFIIWYYNHDVYSNAEAFLLYQASLITPLVFGMAWARKEKILMKP